MDQLSFEQHDRQMMARAIALSRQSSAAGEYPYGVLICLAGRVVAESINRVKHDADVTRHAELVAISAAQKALGSTSLDGCVLYSSSEPCVLCSYAIRESRIGRVVYGLHSPHMGGLSRWNVLKDEGLSRKLPEVFAPPPVVLGGFMAHEAEHALLQGNPLVWMTMKRRGLFVTDTPERSGSPELHPPRRRQAELLWAPLRRNLFDRFGRR
jgi:tRNA(adenine34) deaminase